MTAATSGQPRFCTGCGAAIAPAAHFCTGCGQVSPVSTTAGPTYSNPSGGVYPQTTADETRLQPGRNASRGSGAAGAGRANRGIPGSAIVAACTVGIVVVGLVAFVLIRGAGSGSQTAAATVTTATDAPGPQPNVSETAPPVPAPISTVTVTAPAPAAPAVAAPPPAAVAMPQDAAGTVNALYTAWSSRDDAGVRRLVTAGVYPKFAAAFLDHNDIDSVSNSTNTDERNATGERVCSTQTFYHRSGKQQQEHRCFQVQAGSSGDIVVDSQGPWAITEWH